MNWDGFVFISAIIGTCFTAADSVNILAILSIVAPSHFRSFQPLLERIIERGYNLTLVSVFPLDENLRLKHKFVDMKHYYHISERDVPNTIKAANSLRNLESTAKLVSNYAEEILKSPEMQDIINSRNTTYDLVLTETFFFDAFFALGYKFDAPTIGLATQAPLIYHTWISGNPIASSYVPDSFLHLSGKLSFISRLINAAFHLAYVLHYEFVISPRSQYLIENYFHFEKDNTPHIKDIMRNISVILVNAHYTFGYPRPNLPNIINIAGLHLSPQNILPHHMQKFMDDAQNGVIYFSLGSVIRPEIAESIGNEFVRAMKDLPQRAIMKWSPKFLSFVPDNILVDEWIPQNAVLNHPNCHLFITHGGLLSLLESLNASVPVIGIPFFGDQPYNLAMVEYYEIGMLLKPNDVSIQLSSKINEILMNPKYKKNMEKRSILFRDGPVSQLDTAMYWVDHVIQHKNATHLNFMPTQLTWYKFYSLDVCIIFSVWILLTIWIVKFSIIWIIQKLCNLK